MEAAESSGTAVSRDLPASKPRKQDTSLGTYILTGGSYTFKFSSSRGGPLTPCFFFTSPSAAVDIDIGDIDAADTLLTARGGDRQPAFKNEPHGDGNKKQQQA